MTRILAFSQGPQDWQALLADPVKHWRKGYSARTLAHSWEAADGLPPEVAVALAGASDPVLEGIEPVLAIPEFKVPLPGGVRASQNDIFVLARSLAGPVSIVVEGKVAESFGPKLGEWFATPSDGKKTRLNFLLKTLGLTAHPDDGVRYQLLHRTASAILVGEQFRATAAVMLVHSFSQEMAGWEDYQAFTQLFGVEAQVGVVQKLGDRTSIPLFGCWVVGNPAFLDA